MLFNEYSYSNRSFVSIIICLCITIKNHKKTSIENCLKKIVINSANKVLDKKKECSKVNIVFCKDY